MQATVTGHKQAGHSNYLIARGWLTKREREWLFHAAQSRGPNEIIVNVGVEYGASLHCLGQGNPDAIIWAIDIDLSKIRGIEHLSDLTSFIEQDSAETVAQLEDNQELRERAQIGLAFIDGDHSYNGVMADTGFAKYIVPGGLIAFHDCYRWDGPPLTPHAIVPEVNQAVSDWYAIAQNEGWQELSPVDSMRIFVREP